MSDMNTAPADDPLARQLARLAPRVDMGASRAAFDAARLADGSAGGGDGPRWWLAAAVVLLVITGVFGVWAIRGNDPADVPAVSTDPPTISTDAPTVSTDGSADDSPDQLTATGVTVPLPTVGAPALHNTSAGLVWVVAHDDGTVSVLPATLDGNIASDDTTVSNLKSLVRVSSSGRSFSGDVGHWDDHGRAITTGREDDLTGYAGHVVGDEVEILRSTETRVPGDPDADLDGEEYPIPDFGEPIDVMTFMTLSSSGPVWRHLDASLVVEGGVGRICDAPTALPVDELVGCGDGVALDTQIRSTTPEITTWFHPPLLAFQDPSEGFTHVIPLAGYSSRNEEVDTEPTTVPPTTAFDRAGVEHVPDPVPGSEWTVIGVRPDDLALEIAFLGHRPLTEGQLCTADYTAAAEETDEVVTIHLSADLLTKVGNAIASCAVPDTQRTVVVELDAPLGDRRLQSGDGTELTVGRSSAPADAGGVLTSPPADPIDFLAIGDSVMLGAADELNARGYTVDALVIRQLGDVVPQVTRLVEQGLIDDTPIVIHLGNNGPIAEADLDALLDVLADYSNVVLLNDHADRAWIDRNNDLIQNADLRPNVVVIDWKNGARRCGDDCLAADGVHLSTTGVEYYADMIREVVGR